MVAEQARAAADHANQAKTRYISTISHELRTPLNSILGYAQMLHEDTGCRRTGRRRWVIHRGGEHLLSLIEGTLDIARIESGKLTLNTAQWPLPMACMKWPACSSCKPAPRGWISASSPPAACPPPCGPTKAVAPDPHQPAGQRRQVHPARACGTACGPCPRDGPVRGGGLGPGLSAQDMERVFEPFARGSTAVGQAQGTGWA